MKKYNLLFISQNDDFKNALSEQLCIEYNKVHITDLNNAEDLISNNHFDCFLIDTEDLDKNCFINNLSAENLAKPFIFFVNANNKNNNIINSLLSDNNKNYIRQTIYRPFKLEDFFNTLNANLNKYEKGAGSIIKIGEFKLDQGHKELLNEENQVITKLTEKEVDILRYLFKNKNNSIKKEQLLEQIWGYQYFMDTHTLETHIYRLRQKIKAMAKYLITDDKGYSINIDN